MKRVDVGDQDVLKLVCEVLGSGGVVIHPTETCYGLAVDVRNRDALAKLYALKGRDFDKPVSILVDSVEMARRYGEFSEIAVQLCEKYWPGALSLLLPRGEELPEFLNPGSEFVSMRVSGNKFCREMVREFAFPVTTTSANLAGEPEIYDSAEIDLEADLLVDAGKLPKNKPSTIVKIAGNDLEILRQGEIYPTI